MLRIEEGSHSLAVLTRTLEGHWKVYRLVTTTLIKIKREMVWRMKTGRGEVVRVRQETGVWLTGTGDDKCTGHYSLLVDLYVLSTSVSMCFFAMYGCSKVTTSLIVIPFFSARVCRSKDVC